MVSLKIIVVFFFAQFVNCGLFAWVLTDLQHTCENTLAIKVCAIYNAVLFVVYVITILFLCIINARRETSVLVVDNLSTTTTSLDIEEN